MKLTTDVIKYYIVAKDNSIEKPSLKRISKSKNSKGNTVRVFSSSSGEITVVSNSKDTEIVSITQGIGQKTTPLTTVKKPSKYLFAVSKEPIFDDYVKKYYIHVSIVPRKYWEKEKTTSGEPISSIEDKLADLNIWSPNDTSDHQAFDWTDPQAVIKVLEKMKIEYSNDLAKYVKDELEMEMWIKP